MPVTLLQNGTLAAAVDAGTPALNYTSALNRTFQAVFDLTNMGATDTVIIQMFRKVLSTGSQVLFYQQTFTGDQSPDGKVSVPFISPHEINIKCFHSAGSGSINIPYSIEAIT